MIDLNGEIFDRLGDGYGTPAEVVRALSRLYENIDDEPAWKALFEELHHQGDLSQLSYAAVPHILEIERTAPHFNWNGFGLLAVIEQCRPRNDAPQTGEIAQAYRKAWDELPAVTAARPGGPWDDLLTAAVLSCLAFARGQRAIACVLMEMDERLAREIIRWHQDLEDEDVDDYI